MRTPSDEHTYAVSVPSRGKGKRTIEFSAVFGNKDDSEDVDKRIIEIVLGINHGIAG